MYCTKKKIVHKYKNLKYLFVMNLLDPKQLRNNNNSNNLKILEFPIDFFRAFKIKVSLQQLRMGGCQKNFYMMKKFK